MQRSGRWILVLLIVLPLVLCAFVVLGRWGREDRGRRPTPQRRAAVDLARTTPSPVPTLLRVEPQGAAPSDLAEVEDEAAAIVINEIAYHSRSGDRNEEWIELFNRSYGRVELGGWRLGGDVTFEFPPQTALASGGFLVVAASVERLRPYLGDVTVVGNWKGELPDGGGEVSLQTAGGETADAARWDDEPPYPVLAAGFGSSLERRSPHQPSDLPQNWGASNAAGWVRVVTSGRVTSGTLYLYLGEAGEALVDDVIVRQGGNLAFEESFEADSGRWSFAGTHEKSSPRAGEARSGSHSLALVATGPGRSRGSAAVASGLPVTVGESCEVELWVRFGRPRLPLTVRFSGAAEGSGDLWATVRSRASSPGARNSLATEVLPPLIGRVRHAPSRPRPDDTLTVEARIFASEPPASVLLDWKRGTRATQSPMRDDGAGGDRVAGDGIYSASLGSFPAGTLLRYWVEAADAAGGSIRQPAIEAPTTELGVFVEAPYGGARLRVFDLFVEPDVYRDLMRSRYSDLYHSATCVYAGEVFCNVGVRFRGQTSRGYPKPNWKIKLNNDHRARLSADALPIRTLNLNGAWSDKTFLRDFLAHDLWRTLGEPSCEVEHALLRVNGEPQGLYVRIENPGSTYLARNGLEVGWLWKAYSPADGPRGRYELKEGDPQTGTQLLAEFLTRINELRGSALEEYIRGHMKVSSFTNYLVANQLVHNADHIQKNFLIYADPGGRFTFLPWDLDLTHGRNFECRGSGLLGDYLRHDLWDDDYNDDALLFGTRVHPKCDGWVNGVIDAFLRRCDAFRPEYYRRLAEALVKHYHPDVLVPKIRSLARGIRAEVQRDRARWGTFHGEKDFDDSIDAMCEWVRRRYDHLRRKLEGLGITVAKRER